MGSYDLFFGGDGSKELMRKYEDLDVAPGKSTTAAHPFSSLTEDFRDGAEFEVADDTDSYISTRVDLEGEDRYTDTFLRGKKEIYARFDFLALKSAALRGRAVKESDLILEDSDTHIIEYLMGHVKDYYMVRSVAQLVAYENMGIYDVMFQQSDGCAMCMAVEGSIFYTRKLMRLFTSGSGILHPYCDCTFFPVIRRGSYRGLLGPILNIDSVSLKGTEVHNLPVELNNVKFRKMLESLPFDKVSFVDIFEYRNTILAEKGADDVVMHYDGEEKVLNIHNDYIGTSGPFQYVREYLRAVARPDKVPAKDLKGLEKYYLDGRTVVLYEGSYWDATTGECVK